MAIKVSLGRLTVPLPFTDLVAEHVYGNAIRDLRDCAPPFGCTDDIAFLS
jgi:hypothetical protein